MRQAGALSSRHRFAAVLLTTVLAAWPARASVGICPSVASSVLADFVADDPAKYVNGCGAADVGVICDFVGTDGLCDSNPACPENQITSIGCTPDNEADACCFEQLTIPCAGCDPIPFECISTCDGPAPPPRSDAETRDGFCADVADFRLPGLAQADVQFSEKCDGSAVGSVCDAVGVAGPCRLEPQCRGLPSFDIDCEDYSEATACCEVLFSQRCETCEPEVSGCGTVCGLLEPGTDALQPSATDPSNDPPPDYTDYTTYTTSRDYTASTDYTDDTDYSVTIVVFTANPPSSGDYDIPFTTGGSAPVSLDDDISFGEGSLAPEAVAPVSFDDDISFVGGSSAPEAEAPVPLAVEATPPSPSGLEVPAPVAVTPADDGAEPVVATPPTPSDIIEGEDPGVEDPVEATNGRVDEPPADDVDDSAGGVDADDGGSDPAIVLPPPGTVLISADAGLGYGWVVSCVVVVAAMSVIA